MTSRPGLELLVGREPTKPFGALVRALGHWYDVRAADAGNPPPAARLANTPYAVGAQSAGHDPHAPLAIWVEDADEVAAAAALGAALVIAPRTADVPPSNEVVLAPVECIDGRRWPPASPFVRSRRRARFGLPAELVIEIGTASAPTMDDAVAATTLALASSGVVVGPLALPALALGLPTVTDDATARWLGATDGVDVLVRPTTAARTSAEDLGRDLKLAARLSSAAVALVRCDHDVAVAARVVVDHLTAARGAVSPTVVLRSRLAELESPLGSLPSQRAVAALIGLGPATARLMMAATTW